jgi:hypothetical protein
MITIRRRREKGKKRLAREAKHMKKLQKQELKTIGANTPNEAAGGRLPA